MTRLYGELASWWPLLSTPADYAEEAAFYRKLLDEAVGSAPRSLLELGSGGGNNASHLKAHFEAMTLVDASPGMLEVSRELNPQCEHLEGDMRTLRLHKEFDCVFVHDAVCYMTTTVDLRQAIETAYLHCRPGGAALFAPDYVREKFKPTTDHGGHDSEDGKRGLRYLEWTWDPEPADTVYTVDYAYLLREGDDVRVVHDRHLEGLFPRAHWLRLLSETGFEPRVVPLEHSEVDPTTHEVFIGRKHAQAAPPQTFIGDIPL